ncbi:MAG: CoA transferase [Rhodospirillaceae bacterium]|nr:CoA transferase [Rhodospirillaceae bacterium]
MPALDGIRILDFTRVLSGPYCTMTLGDLGAEIIKIENPDGGDDSRGFNVSEKRGISTYFFAANRNKRSVALDFRKPEGRDAILAMAKNADVVVENFRTGVMERYGIGYDDLAAVNPMIVFCSVSAYGREGPLKDRAGYDPIVQGESGFMSQTGEEGGEPMRTGISIMDIIAGLFAGQAVMAALLARDRMGRGQKIDVPLFDTAVNMSHHAGSAYLLDGTVMTRVGNGNLVAAPVGMFHASDGPFMLTLTNNRLWRTFCEQALARPDLVDDPSFKDNTVRVANRVALGDILNTIFGTDTRAHWIEKLADAGIPAGEVREVDQALESMEVAARNLVMAQAHPVHNDLRGIRSPMNFSETPVRDPVAAPDLGADTEPVLRAIAGYDDVAVAAMRDAKAIP